MASDSNCWNVCSWREANFYGETSPEPHLSNHDFVYNCDGDESVGSGPLGTSPTAWTKRAILFADIFTSPAPRFFGALLPLWAAPHLRDIRSPAVRSCGQLTR